MGYQIQRLTFGGIFDQSFQLMRDHFVPLTAGFALLYVPYNVAISMVAPSGAPDMEQFSFGKLIGFAVTALAFAVLLPLIQIAATIAISDAYQSRPTSLQSAFERARKLYWPYLGTATLMLLALIPLMLLLVVPGLIFMVYWMLIGPIGVVEGTFGRKALSRSRALVRGHWWRVFGVLMVAGLVSGFSSMGFQLLFAQIPLVGAVLNGLVGAVVATYVAALVVVVYVDLRCRLEDFDLQLLAREVAGDRSGSVQPPRAVASQDAASI